MRVVHVFKDFYPPTTGGIEQHMHLLSTSLARHVDVTVLVPSRSPRTIEESIDGVHVVRTAEFGRYASAPLCPTMPVWLWRLRPDLVHLHFPNPMGDLTYLLSGWRGPLVLTYHADIIKQRRLLPCYQPVLRMLFGHVNRIIATSADYIASSEMLSAHRDKCTVIPLGIETGRLMLSDSDRQGVCELRREHGDRIVVFVGVLRYYKGLDVLVRAMTRVRGRVLIAGRGEERARLADLARTLGLADRVMLLGEVDDTQRRQLLHAADVVVLPSIDRCEAFGISQLEAMACGTPVVSTDLPTGVRHVNRNHVTGLVVPPGDERALAHSLDRLLGDAQLRRRLGEAGRQRVHEHFTADRMVDSTLRLYGEVLAQA
ncbi:MAG TPA: glycosyltransferase [Vicinamibacterales bacterium]|nr:glycosyltransferase [Vicinamibacterales bacterium]